MKTEAAIRSGTMQVTMLLLVAGFMLLALGLAGAPSSIQLAIVLCGLGAALYVTRPGEGEVGYVAGIDVDSLLSALWLAPIIAAVPLVFEVGATGEEVQALGGMLGLIGMANYFLRPVYLLLYGLVRSVRGGRGGEQQGMERL
ncbi:hypothetical protein [Haloarcula nitratireducens]|uniref:Uncharacterized protein n=1 Tax=Haloarcula nitratireducens TaxID=2487749 RepID=A0AAW4PD88_9EURY|nr:hypothetical protein [Halomicroarcula nitratireducens]MBX0295668.1 hypothetical protein [Halomicroarcula nitratireducens]